MTYDNKGQIALWKNTSDHEKAPSAKGHFYAHRDIKAGEKIEVALWRNDSDNAKAPVMKGKVSDMRVDDSKPGDDLPPAGDDDFPPF